MTEQEGINYVIEGAKKTINVARVGAGIDINTPIPDWAVNAVVLALFTGSYRGQVDPRFHATHEKVMELAKGLCLHGINFASPEFQEG